MSEPSFDDPEVVAYYTCENPDCEQVGVYKWSILVVPDVLCGVCEQPMTQHPLLEPMPFAEFQQKHGGSS